MVEILVGVVKMIIFKRFQLFFLACLLKYPLSTIKHLHHYDQ